MDSGGNEEILDSPKAGHESVQQDLSATLRGGHDFVQQDLSATLQGGHELVYDLCCDVCFEDNKVLEAVGFCEVCNDYLCSDCVESQRRTKLTRRHIIATGQEMPTVKPIKTETDDENTKLCPKHSHKEIEYFCWNHDELGCNVCMTVKHRNCKDVDYIMDIAQVLLEGDECNELLRELQANADKSTAIISEKQKKQRQSNKNTDNILKAIQKARQEINDNLDRAEKAMIANVRQVQSENQTKLDQIEMVTVDTNNAIANVILDINTLQNSNKHCLMFIALVEAKKQLTSFQATLAVAEKNTDIKKLEYRGNMKFKEQSMHTDCLGSVVLDSTARGQQNKQHTSLSRPSQSGAQGDDQPSQSFSRFQSTDKPRNMKGEKRSMEQTWRTKYDQFPKDQPKPNVSTTDTSQESNSGQNSATRHPSAQQSPEQLQKEQSKQNVSEAATDQAHLTPHRLAKHVKDVAIDTEWLSWLWKGSSSVVDLVALKVDRIVVADGYTGKVQLIDTSQDKVIHEQSVKGSPLGITKVGTKIAVLLRDLHKIILMDYVNEQLVKIKEIEINGRQKALCSAQGDLMVLYQIPVKIVAINPVVPSMTRPIFSGSHFLIPNYMIVNTAGNLLYVSDCGKDTVTSLTLDGKIQDVYTDPGLKLPSGLCVDKQNYVYVCGKGSNNIHMITPDCRQVKILLEEKDGLREPLSMCYSQYYNSLYVGMAQSNVIKVFRLL